MRNKFPYQYMLWKWKIEPRVYRDNLRGFGTYWQKRMEALVMRRFFVILSAVCMLLSGCQKVQQRPTFPKPNLPTQPTGSEYGTNYETGTVRAGTVTTKLASAEGGLINHNQPFPGTAGKDYTDPAAYTYREFLSATAGLKWAPHTWETSGDRYILDYTTIGFYDLALNADGTGWTILDEMAAGAKHFRTPGQACLKRQTDHPRTAPRPALPQ